METLIFIGFFIGLGIMSFLSGKVIEYIKLPSLLGMMILGMVLGPSFLNIIPQSIIKIAPDIKDIALVTVLFIGGLGISMKQIKSIGRPAILLSTIPALFEGFTIAWLSTIFLNFTFIQGAILGFIIAAVSPAVLIPSMISLIDRKKGQDKAIPQMLLVGASADDTIAITLFTTFLGIYLNKFSNHNSDILRDIINIPLALILSIAIGASVSYISKLFLKYIKGHLFKTLAVFLICLGMRVIEKSFHLSFFNSLLSIMVFGFFIRSYLEKDAEAILKYMNNIWRYGKLYLFSLVGMAINPTLVGNYFVIGIIILFFSLSIRSLGVLISLIGTNLTTKEKLFCVIAYLPKATVQSAKAGIPLENGVAGGEIMQAIAILSVLVTAPLGAIGIKNNENLLSSENEEYQKLSPEIL